MIVLRKRTALLACAVCCVRASPPTREDVARAYLRADAAYRRHRPADPAPINRAFDRATKRLEGDTHPKANAEFRVLKDLGHTLMVGESLPEAVAWLLEHRR